jgi:hypothetical protein
MTNDGGLQDHAVSSYTRDGSNSIGSTAYAESSGRLLAEAAQRTARYAASGGSKAYDLSDMARYPAAIPAAFLPLELGVAGGYLPNIGDCQYPYFPQVRHDLRRYADDLRFGFEKTRDPRAAWFLRNLAKRSNEPDALWGEIEQAGEGRRDPQLSSQSRNLRGFGMAVLEAGIERVKVTARRALVMRHGIGRGHAHADSLNLEFFSHGVRLLPDAGIAGGRPDDVNMQCHLGVAVDGATMHNADENSSATAWTEAFKPMSGAQYVAGSARFAAVPQCARYQRQAAMIDVAGRDESYAFDVLRVAGGRQHLWNTHGPPMTPNDKPIYGVELRAPGSQAAWQTLVQHLNPREGVAGEPLVCTWPLGRTYELHMLAGLAAGNPPPIFARSSLFGHKGEPVFIGDSPIPPPKAATAADGAAPSP